MLRVPPCSPKLHSSGLKGKESELTAISLMMLNSFGKQSSKMHHCLPRLWLSYCSYRTVPTCFLFSSVWRIRWSVERQEEEEMRKSVYVGGRRIPVRGKYAGTCLEIQAEWGSLHIKSIQACWSVCFECCQLCITKKWKFTSIKKTSWSFSSYPAGP